MRSPWLASHLARLRKANASLTWRSPVRHAGSRFRGAAHTSPQALFAQRNAVIVFDNPYQKEERMKEKLATDVRQFIPEYFEAWQEGVTEKILSYYSDDVVINLLGGPALLEGKPAVAENFVLAFTKGFLGNVHKILNFVHQGNQVVIEWMFTAIHKGDFGGIPATGRTVNLPLLCVHGRGQANHARPSLFPWPHFDGTTR